MILAVLAITIRALLGGIDSRLPAPESTLLLGGLVTALIATLPHALRLVSGVTTGERSSKTIDALRVGVATLSALLLGAAIGSVSAAGCCGAAMVMAAAAGFVYRKRVVDHVFGSIPQASIQPASRRSPKTLEPVARDDGDATSEKTSHVDQDLESRLMALAGGDDAQSPLDGDAVEAGYGDERDDFDETDHSLIGTAEWRRSADGSLCGRGSKVVLFEPGERVQYIHLTFQPAFPAAPHIELDCDAESESVTAKLSSSRAFGARIETRRRGELAGELRAMLHWTATNEQVA
ncbi:hypothetical protein [Stratiformator vulcanicus]|nr:hypothetical protein [Stratiformator vulcanicus]